MSFLEQLTAAKGTLADGRKSTNARNSANFARYKFINAVEAQRELVMAEIEGHHDFRPTKEVYVKDDAGNTVYDEVGRAKKITVESKRVIRWYEKIGGEYYTAFKYGVRDVEIKGAKMFHCGPDLEDVISVYDIVEKAANAGELDVKLDAIAREIGYSRTRRGEAPTRDDNAIQVEEELRARAGLRALDVRHREIGAGGRQDCRVARRCRPTDPVRRVVEQRVGQLVGVVAETLPSPCGERDRIGGVRCGRDGQRHVGKDGIVIQLPDVAVRRRHCARRQCRDPGRDRRVVAAGCANRTGDGAHERQPRT